MDLSGENALVIIGAVLVVASLALYFLYFRRIPDTESYPDTMTLQALEGYLKARRGVVRRVWVSVKEGAGLDVAIEMGKGKTKAVVIPDPALVADDVKELQERVDLPVTLLV